MTTLSPAAPPSAPRPPRSGRPRGRLPLTPGRRAALLFGVPVVLAVIVYNAYDLVLSVGTGSFPVRYDNVPVADSGLTISLGGGSATVRGGTSAPGVAQVSGTVTYHLARPSVRQEAGGIGLNCPWLDEGNCSLDATVNMPSGAALTMTTGGGDLTASDLTGGAKLSSDGGNITLTHAAGPLSLSSSGGDLTASDLTGSATLNTDGGNITLTHAAGPLSLSSSGGDVTVSNISGTAATISADGGNINGTGVDIPRVSAASSGGDVTLTFTAAATLRNLQVNADGGNVTVIVPRGQYDVTMHTDGGSITRSIQSDPSSPDVITLTSNGGDISISES